MKSASGAGRSPTRNVPPTKRERRTRSEPHVMAQTWLDGQYLEPTGWATAAANAAGTRLYLGLFHSVDARRRNLVVLEVTGGRIAAARCYADNTTPLLANSHSTVRRILLDEGKRRLYLAIDGDVSAIADDRLLSVWTLDENGDPTGMVRSYA